LPFVIVGGIIGMAGCILSDRKKLLTSSGILVLSSLVVFAVGLLSELSQITLVAGFPMVGLFSSGSTMWNSYWTIRYTTYLSYGFWMALLGAVLMLAASRYRLWPRIKERPLEKTEISQVD
jgi:hypothetical protein